jgi:cobalt/nickel transport system ATP-binding protein
MDTIVRMDGICFGYNGIIPALQDININIGDGERFAVIGSNGTGKSTLLKLMNGLITPSCGKVYFRNRQVGTESLSDAGFLRYFRSSMGFLFQDADAQLFCPTVFDELMFGPLQLGLGFEQSRSRANEVMEMLDIANLADRPPYMLSGGEKKRVAIASILTTNPEVLLLDEPTDGLDPKTKSSFMELLISLSEAGKTIVIATHDLSLVSDLQCTVAVLSEEHRIETIGSADDVLRDTALLAGVNLIHEHLHYHGRQIHSHVTLHRPPHHHTS